MTSKWVVPAVLVTCGVVISTVIAQLATPAVVPPAFQSIDTVESTLPPPPEPAATPGPAFPTAAPPSAVNSTAAPELRPAVTPAAAAPPAAPASPRAVGPGAKTGRRAIIGGESKPRATEPEMAVLRLRHTDAPTVSDLLRNLLAKDELEAVHPTVDPRSNSLILRGPKDDVDRVSKLVVQLDSESEAKVGVLPLKLVPSTARVRSSPGPTAAWPVPNNPYISAPRLPTAADVKLMQDYASLENQSLEAAKAYRKGMESLGENHPQQKERREQIASLVEKSFDVRQELQNQELKQLKERMAKVEQSLSKRAQNRSEIIGKRIKEMLDEDRDLEWNASTSPALPPGYPAGYAVPQPVMIPRTITRPDGSTVSVYEVDPRTAQTQLTPVPVVPNYPGNPAVTNPPAGVSAQNLPPVTLPVPLAVLRGPTTDYVYEKFDHKLAQPGAADPYAQPMGAAQRLALGNANELWLRKEAEVAAWKKKLKEADLRENVEYQAALRDLQAAKRQLENAKRESEALCTLLQLDLESATTELKTVAEDYAEKTELRKRGAVSDEEVRRLRAALQQAEIRVNRAQLLFQFQKDAIGSQQAVAEAAEPAPSAPEKAAPAGADRR